MLNKKNIAATFLTVAFLCSSDALSAPASNPILEVVIFHTQPSVSAKTVIGAASKVTPVLKSMPGFISRTFGQGQHNNEWIDIVKWKSLNEALSAAQKALNNPNMQKLMALMQNHKMYHFSIRGLATYRE